MKIAMIGAGNIGTLMAGELAHKGHEVIMYTSKPEKWATSIDILDPDGSRLFSASLAGVTNDLGKAVENAEYIWIAQPAELFEDLGTRLAEYVHPGQKVGVVPGGGGAEFAFGSLLEKGVVLFGLQRVHSIARLKEYGHSVFMLGRKKQLEAAAIPQSALQDISQDLREFFDLPVEELPNYLSVTLTPSNPILHTTRLYSMFKDWQPGKVFPENIRFYEDWDDSSSRILFACDQELQNLLAAIDLDLSSVHSLTRYYESPTPEALTRKISSIPAFKGLLSPMKQVEEGWVPDFTSRYFTTDFPYGLKIMIDLAAAFQVPAPVMNEVWNWYISNAALPGSRCFSLQKKPSEIMRLYQSADSDGGK